MNDYIPPNTTIIGTCSCCGGPVGVPTVIWSVIPPVPTCLHCGATKDNTGPVIPMIPKPDHHWRYQDTTGGCPYSDSPSITCTGARSSCGNMIQPHT